MFTNKAQDGRNNVCGRMIAENRKRMRKSQRQFAEMLQLLGLDVDKNAIQRIEAGQRFVTDIELVYFAKVLNVSYDALLSDEE